MTDAELVGLARAGNAPAIADLYDRYARLVRAIAFDATGDLALAEDVAQEVFFKAYRKLEQPCDAERFAPWLVEIARHAARDWQRKSSRDPHQFGAATEITQADAVDDRLDELRRAIRQLPDDERLALHLFYLEEQPAELARKALGISSSGFYKLLDRARKRTATIMRQNQEASR